MMTAFTLAAKPWAVGMTAVSLMCYSLLQHVCVDFRFVENLIASVRTGKAVFAQSHIRWV